MGHVRMIIEMLKRRSAQSQPAAPTPSKVYDLPGLMDFSGPSPGQLIMYKREYNLALRTKRDAEAALAKKRLKKVDREVQLGILRNAEETLERFATKMGTLLPLEREYGFPEVDGHAK